MIDPTQPARLGNVYDSMAFQALHMTNSKQDAYALLIDRDGTVSIIGTEHERYAELVKSLGFVGFLSAATDPARLARRLQEAHKRVTAH